MACWLAGACDESCWLTCESRELAVLAVRESILLNVALLSIAMIRHLDVVQNEEKAKYIAVSYLNGTSVGDVAICWVQCRLSARSTSYLGCTFVRQLDDRQCSHAEVSVRDRCVADLGSV